MNVQAGTFGDPIDDEIVVLAVYYPGGLQIVEQYGDQLAGKVVVVISNPIDVETFDELVTPADGSAAREIEWAAADGARVVKAFNTTFARTLEALGFLHMKIQEPLGTGFMSTVKVVS